MHFELIGNKYNVSYYYWDECEDMVSIGEGIVAEMVKKGCITGSTFVNVMSTEYAGQVIDLTQKEINSVEYEVIPVDEELLLKVNDYYKYLDKKVIEKYDNIVFVIKDDPTYSLSNKPYTTTTTIINKKDSKPIIINVKHPVQMDYDYYRHEEYETQTKELIKTICNKKLV